ncbi:MAG: zinc-binding dehydrogenase [Verrucomicrobia bacterium]|nr:zinc-binding dehydrogenase [Verrucomicrobiota bacterium]
MSATMPGLVNYALAPRSVELREVKVPTIGPKDILLKVEAVSICGSDLHQWLGGISWKVNYPCILGHEFGGTIVQAGPEVKRFKEGDRVVSETAAVIDEHSPYTRRGLYNLDPNRLGFGYGVDGAMTQYVKVSERCLHSIPRDLAFERAALTEPCSVAYNAVCVNGRVRPGDHVLVIGPGPIGLLCALMAKLSGAGNLIVSGLPADRQRLSVAREVGAHATLEGDVWPYIKDLGDGYGVDVVIDATGVSASLQAAMQAVRPGGQIIKVGWGPQPMGYSIDPLVQKAVTLQGSFSHNWPVWERVISMIASGQINLQPVINRIAPLKNWEECFTKMHHGEYVKAILKPHD